MYKYNTDPMTGEVTTILHIEDGITHSIPLDPANSDYAEIMRQVEDGTLTIQEADSPE